MDISSDEKENFDIKYYVQDKELFSRAFKNYFIEEVKPMSKDELKEEKIKGQYFQNEEKKTTVSSSEKHQIQNHIKGVFPLSSPLTKEYQKRIFFDIKNKSNSSETKDSASCKRIKSNYLRKIKIILNESLKLQKIPKVEKIK